jgi:hypothetical protein
MTPPMIIAKAQGLLESITHPRDKINIGTRHTRCAIHQQRKTSIRQRIDFVKYVGNDRNVSCGIFSLTQRVPRRPSLTVACGLSSRQEPQTPISLEWPKFPTIRNDNLLCSLLGKRRPLAMLGRRIWAVLRQPRALSLHLQTRPLHPRPTPPIQFLNVRLEFALIAATMDFWRIHLPQTATALPKGVACRVSSESKDAVKPHL